MKTLLCVLLFFGAVPVFPSSLSRKIDRVFSHRLTERPKYLSGEAVVNFNSSICGILLDQHEGPLIPHPIREVFPGVLRLERLSECVYRVEYNELVIMSRFYLDEEEKYFHNARRRAEQAGMEVGRNYLATTSQVGAPNDPLISRQWHLKAIRIDQNWERGMVGSYDWPLFLVVMDTGVERHPDLAPNIERALSASFVDRDPFDDQIGHGTLVAGTACAVGNNAIGGSGVAQQCRIVSLQVGYAVQYINGHREAILPTSAIVAAYYHVRTKIPGFAIVVNSFTLAEYPKFLEEELEMGWNRMIVVAAAGNSWTNRNLGVVKTYPCALAAKHANVLCVAATEQSGELAEYSNRHPEFTTIAAPGTDIIAPGRENGYYLWSGTSASGGVLGGGLNVWFSEFFRRYGMPSGQAISLSKQAMISGGKPRYVFGWTKSPSDFDAWTGWLKFLALLEAGENAMPAPPRARR